VKAIVVSKTGGPGAEWRGHDPGAPGPVGACVRAVA
jgi:hypothetical protein